MIRVPPEDEQKFAELLAQARADSRQAYQQLILPFERLLRYQARRHMRRRLQAKVSASDFIQKTYLKAFESLDQFHGNTYEEFAHWLLGIMDHVADDERRDYYSASRDVSREVPLEKVEGKLVTDPSREAAGESFPSLRVAFRELPYEYQKVIHWRYDDECSFDEIGHRLGRSTDAAKHLFYRALRELKVIARRHKGKLKPD
jgi:RNA polymerase sigma-70 factor (ECF subfamily)